MPLRGVLRDIEAAAVRGWPAIETVLVDGWLWRHTSGGSVRANSVATVTFDGDDVKTSIDDIESLARGNRVAACFTVSDVSVPEDLDARLAARGYVRGDDHVTMAKSIDAHAGHPDGVSIASTPSPEWIDVYLSGLSSDRRAMAPRILQRLPSSARFVGASSGGRLISSGMTIPDGSVASVQCMATLAEARRGGGAQRVLAAIEHTAAQHGCKTIYLQASGDNHGALELYERMGFIVIGHYHTRTKAITR